MVVWVGGVKFIEVVSKIVVGVGELSSIASFVEVWGGAVNKLLLGELELLSVLKPVGSLVSTSG